MVGWCCWGIWWGCFCLVLGVLGKCDRDCGCLFLVVFVVLVVLLDVGVRWFGVWWFVDCWLDFVDGIGVLFVGGSLLVVGCCCCFFVLVFLVGWFRIVIFGCLVVVCWYGEVGVFGFFVGLYVIVVVIGWMVLW